MKRVKLTPTLVSDFKCPVGKDQAFLWDSTVPGLGVRATKGGCLAYVFQGRHQGKCVRMTIGYADVCSIPEAQEVARELQRQIDEGRDPRVDSPQLAEPLITSDKPDKWTKWVTRWGRSR